MNIKEVKDLIQEILQSDISDFELEHTGTKLKLRRGYGQQPPTVGVAVLPSSHADPVAPAPQPQQPALSSPDAPEPGAESEDGLHIITSPIVGTFYQAPSPTAPSYVKIGQMVQEGTTLCIVEAMKLMNEIPSDVAGEVMRIYVENGSPVEYGQKLFAIRPRK